jgi:DNA-binding NarL/FixJ family response regulator
MAGIILIVEDHPAVRESLHAWLAALFPQDIVIAAASGEEAVSIAATISPNVVIMDITLPGMSGIEATRLVKADVPAAHIIMLTIHEEDVYQMDAADAGASAFISKRLMQTLLLPAIRKFLPTNSTT